jgi:hypothetical protein
LRSQYFPAAVVLTLVLLFWTVGMLGGLSLLSRSRPPLGTLAWLLFIYASVVLSAGVGLWAAFDLARRLSRHRVQPAARRRARPRAKATNSGDERADEPATPVSIIHSPKLAKQSRNDRP